MGAAAASIAFFTGSLLSRGPGDDLERVASVLDGLGLAGQGGLDRPIPAVSLDEVGELSVALAHLRVRMRPNLAEHDEALRRANAADRERDHFLTLVSEELRAPLDRILDDSRQLLEGQEPLTPAQREDIRLIVGSSTHLTELIEEVLDLSAIATGQINLRLAEVDLAALANDVGHAQRPLLAGRGVTMQMQMPEAGARIVADERRLRQVLTNLVSNAVKFTQEGTITIEVKNDANACVLRVKDTGPGMPAEQLPKLFTEFVQLGSLRQRARGTGLGLAICKRLIEAHHGTITAESVVGQGSTFTVRLPSKAKSS
jgi:two-component system sensor histidine kinase/response regulator